MQRILRGLEGLPPGTVIVLGRRVVLGRAPDSDLQLLDPEVSRRHAKIELDADDRAILVDLASKAGTFVDGARIDRSALRSGCTIEIGPFCLRYEELEAETAEHKPSKRGGMDALRQTVRFDFGLPSEREPRPASATITSDDTSRIVIEERVVSTPLPRAMPTVVPVQPVQPRRSTPSTTRPTLESPAKVDDVPRRTAAVRETAEVEFAGTRPRAAPRWTPSGGVGAATGETPVAPSGAAAAGPAAGSEAGPELLDPESAREVIRDVFEYRELRLRMLRGESMGFDLEERLRVLEQRLQLGFVGNDPLVGTRRFRRFHCPLPAWIGRRASATGRVSTSVVELEDLGAGGAQVVARGTAPSVGEPCWLAIDLQTGDDTSVLVFRARVVWRLAETDRVGLVFSGAGSCGVDPVELIMSDTA